VKAKIIIFTSVFLSILSFSSFGNNFFVNGLQAPVWVERAGVRLALDPSEELNQQDLIITGSEGKIWLEMADGAIVKLGNNAKMQVKSISVQDDPNTTTKILDAGIDILVGAFRYTTSKLQASQNWQRSVDIQLAQSAVLGIRGTDLWGQVKTDNQFVVLLEGKISVTPKDGSAPAVLDQSLQIFKIENGLQQPIGNVQMSDVQALAPETELDFGQGVQKSDGNYQINLASTQNEIKANRLVSRLGSQGYMSEIQNIEVNE